MPQKCCVPSCYSNYDSSKENGHTTIFKFPTEDESRKRWIASIPRDNWEPTKYSAVCIKHFHPEDLSMEEEYIDKSGSKKTYPRKRPILKESAVPKLFPGLPQYLSKKTISKRVDPNERQKLIIRREEEKQRKLLEADIIPNFEVFSNNFETQLKSELSKWKWHLDNEFVCFYIVDFTAEDPVILCSIKLKCSMEVEVRIRHLLLLKEDLKWILSPQMKVTLWSQITNLLCQYCEPQNVPLSLSAAVNALNVFKRNDFLKPFCSLDDDRLSFLNSFLQWLLKWKALGTDCCLTSDTWNALYQSTSVLIDLIKFLLTKTSCNYVLTGKFQSDALESRFSMYRQLSGGNYSISVRQIYESEKKLRKKSLLNIHSARYGRVKFNADIMNDIKCNSSILLNKEIDISMFLGILDNISMDDTEISDSVILYIAGYVAFKIKSKLQCEYCIDLVCEEVCDEAEEQDYFHLLNRGGLTVPSQLALRITGSVCSVLKQLISEQYEGEFIKHSHQKQLLIRLATCYLNRMLESSSLTFCVCGISSTNVIINSMLPVLANIFINNYVKTCNDKIASERQAPKKRKLATLLS